MAETLREGFENWSLGFYSRRGQILQFLEECLLCASWSTSEVLTDTGSRLQSRVLCWQSPYKNVALVYILKFFFCKNNHPGKILFPSVNLLIAVASSKPCQMYLQDEGSKIRTG